MELADRTVMLLGGSGLVGHAVARRVLAATPSPRRRWPKRRGDCSPRTRRSGSRLSRWAGAMLRDAEARHAGPQSSGSDVEWNAIEPEDTIEPSRFATWVFTVEDKGTRIKR